MSDEPTDFIVPNTDAIASASDPAQRKPVEPSKGVTALANGGSPVRAGAIGIFLIIGLLLLGLSYRHRLYDAAVEEAAVLLHGSTQDAQHTHDEIQGRSDVPSGVMDQLGARASATNLSDLTGALEANIDPTAEVAPLLREYQQQVALLRDVRAECESRLTACERFLGGAATPLRWIGRTCPDRCNGETE